MQRFQFFSLSFVALALAVGCGDQSGKSSPSQTNTPAGNESLVTAPLDYLNTVTKQQQHAVKIVDVSAANKAIQLFQVEQGRNPKDIEELVQQKYLPKIPQTPQGTKLVYDANTGIAKVVKAP